MKNEIFELISSIIKPESGFLFKKYEGAYWGKDCLDNVVFGMKSNDNMTTIVESTKWLSLLLNIDCEIITANQTTIEKLNLLILKNSDQLDIFISLASVFTNNETKYTFLKFFVYLKDLFSAEGKTSTIELQGLYGELYTLIYFKQYLSQDISVYFQSKNMLKFDFSFSDTNKMDVKTTIKEVRSHHFKNEQLNNLRYDIKIVSILMLKDDKGLSLFTLIEKCKEFFSNSLSTLLNIEKIIKNWEIKDLYTISFNEQYIKDNLRVYDSNDIPRLTEKTNEGIYNIEFDSDLTNSKYMSLDEIKQWISKISDKEI